jgi:hypothetical protein
MSRNDGDPVGSPESHWGTKDPAAQPPRDAVLGLGRLVAEARGRLGADATPEAVAADLWARGVAADLDEIRKCYADEYR